MGIEELLPTFSSFIPTMLGINAKKHYTHFWNNYHKDFCNKKNDHIIETNNKHAMHAPMPYQSANKKLDKSLNYISLTIELSRLVPTAITMYGKTDWELCYGLVPYILTTWYFDRWAYHGMIAGL